MLRNTSEGARVYFVLGESGEQLEQRALLVVWCYGRRRGSVSKADGGWSVQARSAVNCRSSFMHDRSAELHVHPYTANTRAGTRVCCCVHLVPRVLLCLCSRGLYSSSSSRTWDAHTEHRTRNSRDKTHPATPLPPPHSPPPPPSPRPLPPDRTIVRASAAIRPHPALPVVDEEALRAILVYVRQPKLLQHGVPLRLLRGKRRAVESDESETAKVA